MQSVGAEGEEAVGRGSENDQTGRGLSRRRLLQASGITGAVLLAEPLLAAETPRAFTVPAGGEFEEATVAELQDGMKCGRLTAHSVTEEYLGRIEEIDRRGPAVNSVIELNPDALAIARLLDEERKEKGPRGPLHGHLSSSKTTSAPPTE